jgi:hypothetical protein
MFASTTSSVSALLGNSEVAAVMLKKDATIPSSTEIMM